MNNDLAKRVAAALSEAKVTVKAHTSTSKKGKKFNVKQHERDLKDLIGKRMTFKNTIASGDTDAYGARMSGIFQGIDKETGMAKFKTAKRGILMPIVEIPALRKLAKQWKMFGKSGKTGPKGLIIKTKSIKSGAGRRDWNTAKRIYARDFQY